MSLGFCSIVWEAVISEPRDGPHQVDQLCSALALHSHLIDTPNPFDANRTPLFRAAMHGKVAAIAKLLRFGSHAIDVPDAFGTTPMQVAAQYGQAQVIEALVHAGSRAIDTPNVFNGRTPMHAAVLGKHVGAIEALVRLGSTAIDTPDDHHCTPIYLAASGGNVEVIDVLVRLGSRAINAPDANGWTPLMIAAERRFTRCVMTLTVFGANTRAALDGLSKFRGRPVRSLPGGRPTEDDVASVRKRAYCDTTLTHRLVVEMLGGRLHQVASRGW